MCTVKSSAFAIHYRLLAFPLMRCSQINSVPNTHTTVMGFSFLLLNIYYKFIFELATKRRYLNRHTDTLLCLILKHLVVILITDYHLFCFEKYQLKYLLVFNFIMVMVYVIV